MPNVFQSLVSSKRVFRELKMLCFFKHDNVSRPTSKFKAETSLKISGFAVGSVFHCTLSPFHGLYVCGAFELCFFHAHPSWLTRNLGIRSPVPAVFLRAWLDVLFFLFSSLCLCRYYRPWISCSRRTSTSFKKCAYHDLLIFMRPIVSSSARRRGAASLFLQRWVV